MPVRAAAALCAAAAVHPAWAGGPAVEAYVEAVNRVPTASALARWHELLGSEPHVAGTDGDWRCIERLRAAFVAMGLRTTVEEFEVPLPRPVSALVEIVGAGDLPGAPGGRRGVVPLPVVERNLAEDPASAHPGLTFGWNAFSAPGDVTAGVVYANYGTKADFDRLRALGIDCRGKVVLARYGGNFRGFKVRFAEEAGAAAVLIFTDPADSGTGKGPVWPEGGWANETCIQRGSVLVGDQPGDPTTPMRPSVEGVRRRSLEESGLPRIPVQPIGYAAASEIVRRMTGAPVPKDAGWTGGIPFEYRLEGGDALRVRVKVEQDRALRSSANVIGVIPGRTHPDQWIIVGCHHDAWGFGAADPLAGTVALMECAASFAAAARDGLAPERTLVFAAWGAEEFGIFGSTEWAEANRARLQRSAVAYVNLDMASMGTEPGASGSPSLRDAFLGAAVRVPAARGAAGETAYDRLTRSGTRAPGFGDLGGGSDHVAFNCHLGVPCVAIGAGGAPGSSYHSNYDTIAWYRATVGADYEPALMVTRMTNAFVAMLAQSAVLPAGAARHGHDALRVLDALRSRAPEGPGAGAIDALRARARRTAEAGARLDAAIVTAGSTLSSAARARIDAALIELDRAWIDPAGLDGRPWFRSLLAASDRDSGYAAVMLPLLAEAIGSGDVERVRAAAERYQRVFDRLDAAIRRAAADVPGGAVPGA